MVVTVHLGFASIGAKPGNRPGLDLDRREGEVHWGALEVGEENKCAREGVPPGAILR
jgi:hypothetical protein